MQGKDAGYLLNNLDEHIVCHVRRRWDESKGVCRNLTLLVICKYRFCR